MSSAHQVVKKTKTVININVAPLLGLIVVLTSVLVVTDINQYLQIKSLIQDPDLQSE